MIDSHCHLNMHQFEGVLAKILERAAGSGVTHMQTVCTKESDIPQILDIINSYEKVFGSVGVHPNHVTEEEWMETSAILAYAKHPKVIGIGETGLDFFREHDADLQQRSFLAHICAAQASGLPVIVHSRAADRQIAQILASEMNNAPFKVLIHCFTGDKEFLKGVLDVGGYISISGIITFSNALELRDVLRYVPVNRLLIETDAPYLAPVPHRGKVNEPSFLPYTANIVANVLNLTLAEIVESTSCNFFELFSRAKKIASEF